MKQETAFSHEFVDSVPELEDMKERTLYISLMGATAVIHLCGCGCGREVVTPLSPTDWKLIFDGEAISLHPSIGNWSFPCQSHYWVRDSQIEWSGSWSKQEIAAGRKRDMQKKAEHYQEETRVPVAEVPSIEANKPTEPVEAKAQTAEKNRGWWQKLKAKIFRWFE